MTNQYTIYDGENIFKLKKGMSVAEVVTIMGQPFQIDKCENPLNIKFVYRLKRAASLNSYLVLFNSNLMVYAVKTK